MRVATRGVRADGRPASRSQAGEPWDPFVARRVADGLAGVECLSGIPGSVGATPIQNVGAYGQEVAETILSVRVLDRDADAVADLAPEACGFTYRSSAFKRAPGRWVVLAVTFALERSRPLGADPLRRARARARRRARAPRAARRRARGRARRCAAARAWSSTPTTPTPSGRARSSPTRSSARTRSPRSRRASRERLGDERAPPAFPQPDGRVKTSAAWLIERAGFHRGHGDPHGIAISAKHTLALTNRGDGTTAELVALAREIAGGVHDRFGVELVPEPVFVGHAWPGTLTARCPSPNGRSEVRSAVQNPEWSRPTF